MKKYFFTGLVILLPLALTIAVVVFLVNLLTNPFVDMVTSLWEQIAPPSHGFLFLSPQQIIRIGSQILILILLGLFTVFLGFITRWYTFKWVIGLSDGLLLRIPLFNKVYKTSQEVTKTFFESKSTSFQQVVMVPFPNGHAFSIGLVTNDAPKECCEKRQADMISVFLPTTPNPTSGYLLMFKREDCKFLDMKVEDAVKFIISCGVIHPEDVEKIKEKVDARTLSPGPDA